ncbi:UNVERIFIED_CONTAM: hypothetical protein FKN15_030322 [Acipenser sinensis]
MASPSAGGSELDGVGEGKSQTGAAGDERLTSAAPREEPPPRSTAVLSLQQHRRMVCAEYPCRVLNVGKMLETLGGEEGMSRTYADPSKRLELYFRPRDPYCHPVCGNRFPSTSMLLRVRRRVPKPRGQGDAAQQSQIDMEILGVICTTYKFQGLADFQYLAVHTEAEGTQSSMYNKILLRRPEKKEFFDQEMPLYIPPPIFSRLDNPVDYFYRPDVQHREGYLPPQLSSENLIGLSRARRPHNAIFVNFEDKAVPTEALEAAVLNWKRVCSHPNEQQSEEELRQLFQSRPVWSRNAVKANLEIHPEKLKLLLPYVAYYMLTGPWRSLWVRFGYDPRKDPKAKAYQVLDFRIRCGMKHGYTPNDMPVKAKRSTYNYSLPVTIKKAGGSELDGVGEGKSQTGAAGDERLTSAAPREEPPPRSTAVLSLQQHRRMVCAEYPCRVLNVGKMLETLGGEEGMSRTYADPSKRLELYFRPRDPYCHPVCGNRFPSTSMLLRVRRRVPKPRGQGDAAQQSQIDMEILGVICTTYKFQGLADFQYLAVHTEAEGTQSSMYNKILLRRPEKKEFFDQEMPLYIPPPIFSRLDNPVDYFYRPDVQHREGYLPPQLSSENLIGLSRARRPHNAIFVNFEDKAVPTEALEAAVLNWKRVCSHPNEQQSEEELRQLFQSRPVWSRNAVKANLEIHPEKLKLLLPYVAYYMLTGPWRSLWVRFGYDPRKDPKAKAYQVLDFRIRCGMKHGYTPNDMPVKAKRSTYNYSLPVTIKKAGPQPASLQEFTQGLTISSTTSGRKPAPSRYKLKQIILSKRPALFPTKTKSSGKERGLLELESGEEEEEEEEEEEFQPSEGSEN